jgi:hypothetical protein
MCITDDDFPRQRAFLYLSEIKQKFLATYGLTAATALPYSMNSEFSRVMSTEMKKCNESGDYDSIQRVQGQIDELKDIMVKNIENITARGERLELLVNKSDNLRDNVRNNFNSYFIHFTIIINFYWSLSGCFLSSNESQSGPSIVLAQRSNVFPSGSFANLFRLHRHQHVLRRSNVVEMRLNES